MEPKRWGQARAGRRGKGDGGPGLGCSLRDGVRLGQPPLLKAWWGAARAGGPRAAIRSRGLMGGLPAVLPDEGAVLCEVHISTAPVVGQAVVAAKRWPCPTQRCPTAAQALLLCLAVAAVGAEGSHGMCWTVYVRAWRVWVQAGAVCAKVCARA